MKTDSNQEFKKPVVVTWFTHEKNPSESEALRTLTRIEERDSETYQLEWRNSMWALHPPHSTGFKSVVLDYCARALRSRFTQSKHQALLARALGLAQSHKKITNVIDLTAGFGMDALTIAKWNVPVIAIEQHPVLYLLQTDAWERARQDPFFAGIPIEFLFQEGESFLENTAFNLENTVLYLDPMYPHLEKASALNQKNLRIAKDLCGTATGETLFGCAIQTLAKKNCSETCASCAFFE